MKSEDCYEIEFDDIADALAAIRNGECVVVVDDDANIRNWKDVIWAITPRMDPIRDTVLIDNTPIDYLDFASPVSGLGSKMGLDATNKWKGETTRAWGTPIEMSAEVKSRIDELWDNLGID